MLPGQTESPLKAARGDAIHAHMSIIWPAGDDITRTIYTGDSVAASVAASSRHDTDVETEGAHGKVSALGSNRNRNASLAD